MKHRPVLYPLLRLHSEIAAEIKDKKRRIKTLRANLCHLSAVIHLFEPTFDLRKIIPKRKHPINLYFKRGDGVQGALGILRTSPKPLTAMQIALVLLQQRGVNEPSKRLWDKTAHAVYAALKFRRAKGDVIADNRKPIHWRLP
jgi:hypothetical protein